MNVLVSYDSSSDDEEDQALSARPPDSSVSPSRPDQADMSLSNGTNPANSPLVGSTAGAGSHVVVEGPLLGPSIPDNPATLEGYEEDMPDELPPMSERDLLRYLTQPQCPVMSLPPEPMVFADPLVTAKFKHFLELKKKGIHFNEDLASKSSFKNPSLFSSLLERAKLPAEAQYASSLPSDVFSLHMLPPWAYKEELLKAQQAFNAQLEVMKKAQSTAGKRTIEFTSAAQDKDGNQDLTPSSESKRKRP